MTDIYHSVLLFFPSIRLERRRSAMDTTSMAAYGRAAIVYCSAFNVPTPNRLTKKRDGNFRQQPSDAGRASAIGVFWEFVFSAFIYRATFSRRYEKLIFLLTLLRKDMALCAPIQDNQVILVHMPPHISPPAP